MSRRRYAGIFGKGKSGFGHVPHMSVLQNVPQWLMNPEKGIPLP